MAMQHMHVHRHVPGVHYDEEGLLGNRPAAAYNPAEQQYSSLLYGRLEQLLKGERNDLMILRRYPMEPNRLGVMPTPNELDRRALRIRVVERMATDALVFLSAHTPGGPVAQQSDGNGYLIETRKFPTRFPHIIIDRVDAYRDGTDCPEYIQWCARRVQNHRSSIRLNQMLDVANLGIEAAKFVLP